MNSYYDFLKKKGKFFKIKIISKFLLLKKIGENYEETDF